MSQSSHGFRSALIFFYFVICGSEFSQQCLSMVCEETDYILGMTGYIYEAQTLSQLGVYQHPEFLLQLWHLMKADNMSEVLLIRAPPYLTGLC